MWSPLAPVRVSATFIRLVTGPCGQQEIDAVVLAQRELTRAPVLVGECKWASRVDAVRIKASLIRQAAIMTPDADELSYVVCARDSVEHADTQTRAVTAADIFTA
jgi:uncharacterized protein